MRCRVSVALAMTLLLAAGCEGVLSIDGPQSPELDAGRARRDAGIPVEGEDAATTPELDASIGQPDETDAGEPDPIPVDASRPVDASTPIDSGPPPDPCGGLDLRGVCDGTTARWCEGNTPRSEACGDRGCGDVSGQLRCLPVASTCASPVEAAELELTNRARRDAGLSDLTCDEGLARAARLHSQDMCNQNYFSHDSRDGRSFVDRIDAQGVRWRAVGENIAQGQTTPEAVHDAWMNSSGHRQNILSSSYGRIGIGYVACGGRHYWTQDFAD